MVQRFTSDRRQLLESIQRISYRSSRNNLDVGLNFVLSEARNNPSFLTSTPLGSHQSETYTYRDRESEREERGRARGGSERE